MGCPTKKKSHQSKEIAETALFQARIQFENNNAIAVYECDSCGDWHLTSKGEMSERLKQAIDDGTLKKEIDKYQWNEKYRR